MKKGITLVELLIVIALIAVLAAINFAVLSKVRQRAYLGSCISNLRQLVLAVHMYENDWGTVPIEEYVKTPDGWWGWFQQRIQPYIHSDALLLCPADYTEGKCRYSDDGPKPQPVPIWRGKEWRISYWYMINIVTVMDYGKGNPQLQGNSPILECDWHSPHFRGYLLARYNGTVEFVPIGLYREIRARFASEGNNFVKGKP